MEDDHSFLPNFPLPSLSPFLTHSPPNAQMAPFHCTLFAFAHFLLGWANIMGRKFNLEAAPNLSPPSHLLLLAGHFPHYKMGWPPFPFSANILSLLLLLSTLILRGAMAGENNRDNGKWSPASIDQLRPFRLTEKRVHEGIGWKRKRGGGEGGGGQQQNGAELSSDWRIGEPEEAKMLEQVPTVGPYADITFLANESLRHVRTPTYELRHDQCLEVHFRVEGKRTRLLLYTCRMFEGGICVLDKFLATTSVKKLGQNGGGDDDQLDICHKMQPWMYLASPFAFHFRFVRRPRKFADREAGLRHFRRRFGRHATREVGRVKLAGFRPCNLACGKNQEDGGEEGAELTEQIERTQLDDRLPREDPLQGWRRR